jgi:hypothetical protein
MFCVEVELEVDSFVTDMKYMDEVPPNPLFILITHLVYVINSSVPTDFVDNNVFYFPVKDGQDVYAFMNLFNHNIAP